MASRYSGYGSGGSRPRPGAKAAIKANRAASPIRRKRGARSTQRKPKDITAQNAVGGLPGLGFDRVG